MKYLCAICVAREADTMHAIDGKHRPVCAPCVQERVPDPPFVPDGPKEEALRLIRRSPGLTFREIREALDIPGCGHRAHVVDIGAARMTNRYCKAVERLAKEQKVERRGEWPHWTYWPAERSA